LRRILLRLLILAGLVAAGFIAWGWYQHAPLAVESAVVSSVYPSQGLTILNATGYVVAQRKASVASKATGRLEWLGVLEGSKVKMGEVVARLENRDTQAMRDLAAANVLVAKANLGQGQADLAEAQLTFKRSDALTTKKFISEAVHDSAVARLSKAQAALAGYEAAVTVAEANLRVSEDALDQTLIRAPFDGVVLTRNASVGDTITPFSQAVDTKGAVVTIADMDTLEVEADVAESSFLSIWVSQPVEIQLDAIPGERFEGVVSRMVPTMDRSKASMRVKIRFVHRDQRIIPEMSARVAFLKREVTEAERKPVLALPSSAVIQAAGGKKVFTIESGRARLQPVQVGTGVGDLVAVSGLDAGTRVVLNPPEDLTEGRTVKEVAQ
jgi:RND family efflux transporter MFP subunit